MGSRRSMAESNRQLEARTLTIISHRHKFIFVRPRKVAGTSLEISLSRCLGEDDVTNLELTFHRDVDADYFSPVHAQNNDRMGTLHAGHDLPDEIQKTVGEDLWAEYFKFTVVRNPWSLLISFLHHKFGPWYWWDVWGNRHPIDFVRNVPRASRLLWLRRTFARGCRKQAVETILRENLFPGIRCIPQYYFSRGKTYADYVIRFENLQQGYDEVCRRLGLPPQILLRTKTRPRPKGIDYRDYYTDFSREYIADLCRPMIDAFGYRFDDAERRRSDGG